MRQVVAPELLFEGGTFHSGRAIVFGEHGEVESIGEAHQYPDALQLTSRALLPGLVNAHSHAFQRAIRGAAEQRTGTCDFWSWRNAMYRAANRLSPRDLFRTARMAFLEMALGGITTVGEFHYIHRDSAGNPYDDPNQIARLMIEAAREVGLRICLLRVAYFRSGYSKPPDPLQRRFLESGTSEFLRNAEALSRRLDKRYAWAGVAPHSVRAVPLPDIHTITEWARQGNVPVHMHASEQPAELRECTAEYGLTPIALLARERLLHPDFTAVHGIHITGDEIAALAASGATVCACPTTERNLGDGIIRAGELIAAGVPVALGSDSQAQIDLLEDARELEYHLRLRDLQRGFLAANQLFHSATAAGARSLAVPHNAGDFFSLDLAHPSVAGTPREQLLPAIVFGASRGAVQDVIVGGQFIVRDGRHPAAQEITGDYREVMR